MPWCELCDEACDGPIPICLACHAELPWLQTACICCSVPLTGSHMRCGTCLSHPPAFTQSIMPWRYAFPVDRLITAFKHQGKWPYGRVLADVLIQNLRNQYAHGLPKPDVLIPTPLSAKRLRRRGFNQAQMLTRWLSHALDIPYQESLVRVTDTPTQQGLTAKARQKNLRAAFALTQSVKNLHVALIDDVLTTGATANAMATALIQAHAVRVDVYCLARTPAPGEQ